MGTRSTVCFVDNFSNKPICKIYQQYDGYIDGVGHELAHFLKTKTLVNGFGDRHSKTIANGMGCLAAQYIAHIKEGVGNVYLTGLDDSQEYDYTVSYNGDNYVINVDGIDYSPDELLSVKD